jgi:hypothetical protein
VKNPRFGDLAHFDENRHNLPALVRNASWGNLARLKGIFLMTFHEMIT